MYEKFKNYLSEERLNTYLILANNDKEKAIELYELNLKYSSELYLLLSNLEVILRNSINSLLIKEDSNWLLNLAYFNNKILNNIKNTKTADKKTILEYKQFFKYQNAIVENTIKGLQEANKKINTDNLIAKLSFGFWTKLFNKIYETNLWNRNLYKIFKQNTKRGSIEHELNDFRRLRNRIAHNECVLSIKYKPIEYKNKIIHFLNLIDNDIASWVEKQMSRDLFD